MKLKIVGGGRGIGNTFKELLHALEELDKLKVENELLLTQKKDLESKNDRLKNDKEEMANRDLQIAKEADKLSMAYKEEHEKYKALMLNVEKARKEIEELKPNNPNYRYYLAENWTINKVLEVFDKYLGESEDKE